MKKLHEKISPAPVQGAGLGLRRALMAPLAEYCQQSAVTPVDFVEVAPENWIRIGGRLRKEFMALAEQFPLVCHGLSLSLGGPEPLDMAFLKDVKGFLDKFDVCCYTEHLSYCSDHGHLYDLMPLPFTDESVRYVAARIRQVQDFLERPLGVEHVSYYASMQSALPASQALTEAEFINAVLEEANCGLLLDVNNVYVNSINHQYDPETFLRSLPGERIMYVHVAGHYDEEADLKIDTHGSDVIEPVWALLDQAYDLFGVLPTLLERDFNFPPLSSLLEEVARIHGLQAKHGIQPQKHVRQI